MDEKYQPPSGPPPGYQQRQQNASGQPGQLGSNNPFRNPQQAPHANEQPPEYQPPSGPPPNWSDKKQPPPQDEYAPPSGPPPSHASLGETYLPPSGPPPSHTSKGRDEYLPPPGPPPSHQQSNEPAPPPYDPWMAIPDNALLPPPPSFKQDTSPTANADYDDAAKGHAWIRQNPLWQPRQHPPETLALISQSSINLTAPPGLKNATITPRSPSRTHVRTTYACQDTIFLSSLPLYTALSSSPLVTERPTTVYFELHVLSMGTNTPGSGDAGIALGFLAPPYPSWRLPGWHRASLGIHGDDGRRYVDDSYGGKDFTHAFRKGDVVGIGMAWSVPPSYRQGGGKLKCEVFFTRNGRRDGGWDLHEERDADVEEGDVTGLEGEHDLLAAVGCFGGVEFEAVFNSAEWKFRP